MLRIDKKYSVKLTVIVLWMEMEERVKRIQIDYYTLYDPL